MTLENLICLMIGALLGLVIGGLLAFSSRLERNHYLDTRDEHAQDYEERKQ